MNRRIILSVLLCLIGVMANAQKLSISKATKDCGRTGYMVPVTAEFEIRNKGLAISPSVR